MARPKSKTTVQLEAIAAKSGLGVKYLRQLTKSGMPISDVPAAVAWLNNRPDQGTASTDDDSVAALRREKIRLTAAQAEKAEHALAVQRGEFISIEEHQEAGARVGAAMAAAFKALERELPSALAGLEMPAARRRTILEIRKMRQLLADDQSGLWKKTATLLKKG